MQTVEKKNIQALNERSRAGAMFPNNKIFYRPSKQARYLAILDSLADNSRLSQVELGERADLSCAMVNQYLKDMLGRSLIRYERINGKSYRYVLTREGESLRQSMFSDYSSETVRIYSALKDLVEEKLRPLAERGLFKLALFGASETCEIVLSAIGPGGEFDVTALVDNDPELHGKTLGGYIISPPRVLEVVRPQAVVISSFGQWKDINRQLLPYAEQFNVEIVRL